MILKDKTVGVISLGCDKNRVDTEKMLSVIGAKKLTNDLSEAQIVIINSCAFLESARKETLDTVFECDGYRRDGKLEKIVMTGCMPQKFIDELFDELTEVDVFLGTNDYDLLPESIEEAYRGNRVNYVGKEKKVFARKDRVVTTPLHYAYLKIADGCNNHCTYCLIPSIRGRYRSEREEDLLREAEGLGEIAELILVAQDITRYGEDLYGKPSLCELIRKLTALDNVRSVRLLYCYPDVISDELIDEIAANEKVIKYIDIPLQHADDRILKRMNRKGTREQYLALIGKLREKIPDIAIRSTFIAGFPGETEENFANLVSFLDEAKLNNAGFFAYSREEGTPASKLPDQIDEKTKKKRVAFLYRVQKSISRRYHDALVGKTVRVLADGIDYEKGKFVGRAWFSAPEIDGKVYFEGNNVVQGKYYGVKITRANAYDLYGRVTDEFTE
ncbi:MAG: 30S ribosomal protein S12 methylthiotransferase RimO [Candidatus Borkfalkiaceae bacterium]|nr:30S ribosomal protein S12 methylthiotransferase RimO [Christensenellaceae bacterium]